MKKTILILTAILITVFVALSFLGLKSDEYAAEKLFYQSMKINRTIAVNPDVAPPALVASAEDKLQKILSKYPDTNAAKKAGLALVEFYIANKKYDKALSAVNSIIDKYKDDMSVLSTAQFLKGVAYERQNKWDSALKEFLILRDKYTNSQLGLQIPMYIGNHYRTKDMITEADAAYNDAAQFYKKLEADNKGKGLGYIASTLLIQAYLALKNYEAAGTALEETLSKYPSLMTYAQLLPYVEPIFVEKLKNPAKVIEIYKNIKGKTQDKKLSSVLETKIKKLGEIAPKN